MAPPEGGERAGDADAASEVEERYDFDDFGPADMAEMSPDEWEAAFDADSWVTGPDLLDRVEQELRARVATREVFAVVERDATPDGERLVAYSDEGYALVYPDGSVEGTGTVLRDVKPTVALCSMADYDPAEPGTDAALPDPADVEAGTGRVGNLVLQVVGLVQVAAGLVLLGAWVAFGLSIVAPVAGFAFFVVGAVLLVLVANARLSDRFRAREFRQRLRDAGVESGERPDFVPGPPGAGDEAARTTADTEDGDGTADGQ